MSELKTTMNLQEIISNIEQKKILLPDFQRKFVWKEEERQRKIVASILTKMPIGSILLLESNPSDYSSKVIGCKTIINIDDANANVEFLLDGQQRITVLTNVFSNVIHNKCNKVSDLVSPTLKRRFFLRIPKWKKCREEQDLLGVYNLDFKYKNPDSTDPDFLSSDIMPFINCFSFNTGDKNPYNPENGLSTELDEFCFNNEDGYLLPLFLMTPSSELSSSQAKLRLKTIRKNISQKIKEEIEDYFETLQDEDKQAFIDEIFVDDKNNRDTVKNNYSLLNDKLAERAEVWESELEEYLESCVKNVILNKIVVSSEKRARAIDIYENLNIGGVCLNIFDLIMAKVAKVDNKPYYDRLVNAIKKEKVYLKEIIPSDVAKCMKYEKHVKVNGEDTLVNADMLDDKKYNASMNTKCYNEDKNEISQKFIDAFLNTLSLYTYNNTYDPEKYKVELIKRTKILDITPQAIHDNTERICTAIDRALLFFQTRCGIRNISELNYSLMLSMVATLFTNDTWYNDVKVHEKLEAWYWSSLFSGSYDRDQNTVFIQDLQSAIDMLMNTGSTDWISRNMNYILAAENFSDERLILMEKNNEERYPKKVLRTFICQYLLAKTYSDMFDNKKIISVFSKYADSLEAHHIIPLGSMKKYGETTDLIRNDSKKICNSPLNFVFITKKSNDAISDESLDSYIKKITNEAKSVLSIQNYNNPKTDEANIKELLKARYVALQGDIKSKVERLLR